MKVYIVTSGEYSDYGINRVFLDKEKAEKYVRLSQNGWNHTDIEEWETDDDKQINEITYIHANYTKDSKWNPNGVKVEIRKTNDLDSDEKNHHTNYFWLSTYSGEKDLNIERVLHGKYDEYELQYKYEKVCYDLMAKIESLLHVEGWTEKMVQDWLNQNAEEYINKN